MTERQVAWRHQSVLLQDIQLTEPVGKAVIVYSSSFMRAAACAAARAYAEASSLDITEERSAISGAFLGGDWVIWDQEHQLAARSFLSSIHLHWCRGDAGSMWFSTSLRSLIPHLPTLAFDRAALSSMCARGAPIGDAASIITGIRQLSPGASISAAGVPSQQVPHWQDYLPPIGSFVRPERYMRGTLASGFLQSDAPRVATLNLSGGVDSSAVLVAGLEAGWDIRPLHWRFPEAEAIEPDWVRAQRAAAAHGRDMSIAVLRPESFIETLVELSPRLPVPWPHRYLSAFQAAWTAASDQGVSIVLSGTFCDAVMMKANFASVSEWATMKVAALQIALDACRWLKDPSGALEAGTAAIHNRRAARAGMEVWQLSLMSQTDSFIDTTNLDSALDGLASPLNVEFAHPLHLPRMVSAGMLAQAITAGEDRTRLLSKELLRVAYRKRLPVSVTYRPSIPDYRTITTLAMARRGDLVEKFLLHDSYLADLGVIDPKRLSEAISQPALLGESATRVITTLGTELWLRGIS